MVRIFGNRGKWGCTHTTTDKDNVFVLANMLRGCTVRAADMNVDVFMLTVAFFE